MNLRLKAFLWVVVLFALFAGCGKSGVVGGECRPDWVLCGEECINPDQSFSHCGRCFNECREGDTCDRGVCREGNTGTGGMGASGGSGGAAGDGSGGNAGNDAGGSSGNNAGGSSGNSAGGNNSGGSSTGGGSGNNAGGTGGGPVCLPPFDTASQCGDCDTVCPVAQPLCAPVDDGFECVPACPVPLVACADQCVDTTTHPLHCGRCFNICPSGICLDSVCQGSMAGHVVYACMSYEQSFQNSAQTTLLGNAVFLPNREPVRVLAYSEYAVPAVMANTDRTIRWAGNAPLVGRSVEITRTRSLNTIDTTLSIADYDVFLVYDQELAPPGELDVAGATLAATLDLFTRGGGVVIMLSSGLGAAEMPEFATASGLVGVGVETAYTYELAYMRASGDALGVGVVTPFMTLPESCTFATTETPAADTVFVTTDTAPGMGLGDPVVLHKIVGP